MIRTFRNLPDIHRLVLIHSVLQTCKLENKKEGKNTLNFVRSEHEKN